MNIFINLLLHLCNVYVNIITETSKQQTKQEGTDIKTLEIRYERAIKEIGGAPALMELPKQIKDVLKNTKDLQTKVRILEEIAKAKVGTK